MYVTVRPEKVISTNFGVTVEQHANTIITDHIYLILVLSTERATIQHRPSKLSSHILTIYYTNQSMFPVSTTCVQFIYYS